MPREVACKMSAGLRHLTAGLGPEGPLPKGPTCVAASQSGWARPRRHVDLPTGSSLGEAPEREAEAGRPVGPSFGSHTLQRPASYTGQPYSGCQGPQQGGNTCGRGPLGPPWRLAVHMGLRGPGSILLCKILQSVNKHALPTFTGHHLEGRTLRRSPRSRLCIWGSQ